MDIFSKVKLYTYIGLLRLGLSRIVSIYRSSWFGHIHVGFFRNVLDHPILNDVLSTVVQICSVNQISCVNEIIAVMTSNVMAVLERGSLVVTKAILLLMDFSQITTEI